MVVLECNSAFVTFISLYSVERMFIKFANSNAKRIQKIYSEDIVLISKNLDISHNMDINEPNTNEDFEWATRLNRIMLSLVGIWPSVHKNTHDKFLSNVHAIFTFIILVFIGLIPLIHSLVKIWGDILLMIDNLQVTLPITIDIIKFVVVWWKKTDLLTIINMIADDWIKTKTDKERCNMIKYARNARVLTIAGYSIMILGTAFLVILPCFGKSGRYITNVTNPDKILPFPTHYIYDKNQSPYFEFTYLSQTFLIIIAAATYSGVDNLLGLLIFHLCGQLENLKEKLININHFHSYNEEIAFIVKEHTRLIKCFHIIENTFTLLLLGLLVYFSIVFCLYGFIILTIFTEGRKMSVTRFIYLMSILVNIGGHMCLFCALGEILITKCEAIYCAACEYEWYELNPQKAKILLLIMIRAKEPLYITAGNMFPMTMSMFCNLIKTSAGYISVLFAMQSKKS